MLKEVKVSSSSQEKNQNYTTPPFYRIKSVYRWTLRLSEKILKIWTFLISWCLGFIDVHHWRLSSSEMSVNSDLTEKWRRWPQWSSSWPPTLFKEAVSIALRVRTFCIPGLRWHQTPSPTKPQSLYISFFVFVYVSLTLFPWRSSSSIEFSPTKVRLVAWNSSPGQDLDTVHGERGRGGGRMVGR